MISETARPSAISETVRRGHLAKISVTARPGATSAIVLHGRPATISVTARPGAISETVLRGRPARISETGHRSAISVIVRPGVTFHRGPRAAKAQTAPDAPAAGPAALHQSGPSASAPDYFDAPFFFPPLRKWITERREAASDFRVWRSAVSSALSVWLPAVSSAPAV